MSHSDEIRMGGPELSNDVDPEIQRASLQQALASFQDQITSLRTLIPAEDRMGPFATGFVVFAEARIQRFIEEVDGFHPHEAFGARLSTLVQGMAIDLQGLVTHLFNFLTHRGWQHTDLSQSPWVEPLFHTAATATHNLAHYLRSTFPDCSEFQSFDLEQLQHISVAPVQATARVRVRGLRPSDDEGDIFDLPDVANPEAPQVTPERLQRLTAFESTLTELGEIIPRHIVRHPGNNRDLIEARLEGLHARIETVRQQCASNTPDATTQFEALCTELDRLDETFLVGIHAYYAHGRRVTPIYVRRIQAKLRAATQALRGDPAQNPSEALVEQEADTLNDWAEHDDIPPHRVPLLAGEDVPKTSRITIQGATVTPNAALNSDLRTTHDLDDQVRSPRVIHPSSEEADTILADATDALAREIPLEERQRTVEAIYTAVSTHSTQLAHMTECVGQAYALFQSYQPLSPRAAERMGQRSLLDEFLPHLLRLNATLRLLHEYTQRLAEFTRRERPNPAQLFTLQQKIAQLYATCAQFMVSAFVLFDRVRFTYAKLEGSSGLVERPFERAALLLLEGYAAFFDQINHLMPTAFRVHQFPPFVQRYLNNPSEGEAEDVLTDNPTLVRPRASREPTIAAPMILEHDSPDDLPLPADPSTMEPLFQARHVIDVPRREEAPDETALEEGLRGPRSDSSSWAEEPTDLDPEFLEATHPKMPGEGSPPDQDEGRLVTPEGEHRPPPLQFGLADGGSLANPAPEPPPYEAAEVAEAAPALPEPSAPPQPLVMPTPELLRANAPKPRTTEGPTLTPEAVVEATTVETAQAGVLQRLGRWWNGLSRGVRTTAVAAAGAMGLAAAVGGGVMLSAQHDGLSDAPAPEVAATSFTGEEMATALGMPTEHAATPPEAPAPQTTPTLTDTRTISDALASTGMTPMQVTQTLHASLSTPEVSGAIQAHSSVLTQGNLADAALFAHIKANLLSKSGFDGAFGQSPEHPYLAPLARATTVGEYVSIAQALHLNEAFQHRMLSAMGSYGLTETEVGSVAKLIVEQSKPPAQ